METEYAGNRLTDKYFILLQMKVEITSQIIITQKNYIIINLITQLNYIEN
jgi:hypothetical protein